MTRSDGDPTHIEWHRQEAGRQLILGVDGEAVRIAVAVEADAPKAALDAVLAELEREFDHYRATDGAASLADGNPSPGAPADVDPDDAAFPSG